MRGTLRTITSSSVRTLAARIGSAPFLFPAGTIVPDSGAPPSMTNFSMSLGRRPFFVPGGAHGPGKGGAALEDDLPQELGAPPAGQRGPTRPAGQAPG